MTVQIRDVFVFEQRFFALMDVQGSALFDPRQEGLAPHCVSTAYYRGYDCAYRVDEKQLLLETFRIGLKPLDRLKVKYGKGTVLRGQRPHLQEDWCLAVYEQLGWHVPFTGGLVVARDFIPGLVTREKSVVSSVSSPIWRFSEVHELHFVEGQRTESFDCSSAMAEIRQRVQTRASEEAEQDWHGVHLSLEKTFRQRYPHLQW